MLKEAIEKIIEIKDHEMIKVDDITLIKNSGGGYQKFEPPRAIPISGRSLQAVCDFINKTKPVDTSKLIVNIESPGKVSVISELDDIHRNRETFFISKYENPVEEFEEWRNTEDFTIFLQSSFNDSTPKQNLLKFVGTMSSDIVETHNDDGISQTISIKSGVKFVDKAVVPNPVTLRPFRTFSDVVQPKSEFIFRVKKIGGEVMCRLITCDNNRWKETAVQHIKDFILENLDEPFKSIPILG